MNELPHAPEYVEARRSTQRITHVSHIIKTRARKEGTTPREAGEHYNRWGFSFNVCWFKGGYTNVRSWTQVKGCKLDEDELEVAIRVAEANGHIHPWKVRSMLKEEQDA